MKRGLPLSGALLALFSLVWVVAAADRDYRIIAVGGEPAQRPKQVLFFGLQDSAISHHDPPGLYSALRDDFEGQQIELTFTDDLNDLNHVFLANFDAIMVYGNVRLIYPDQESALLDFVVGGGGLVGVHVASWTFTNSPAYGTMIGGRFKGHHAITEYSQTFADAEPAILSGLAPYTSEDEPYLNQAFSPDIKVLSWRDPVGATEIATNFKEPYTWIRYQGLGRVFYHAGGHDYRTWSQAGFRELLARGVHWVCRGALGGPRVSDSGKVVFEGEFDTTPAIWKDSSADGLVPLARSGDPSPPSIGGSWNLPASAFSVESGEGEISFIAGLDPGDTGIVQTLISEREGVLSALLADGDTVPGLGAGVSVTLASSALAADFSTSANRILVRVGLAGTGSQSDDSAVISLAGGAASVLAREGDQVPGLPGGVVFGDLTAVDISMGEDGNWAMAIPIAGLGVTGANNSAVLQGGTGTGTATTILREGSALASLPGVVLGEVAMAKVAGSGRVLVNAALAGAVTSSDDAALLAWSPADGSLIVMLREGDPAGAGKLRWSGTLADSWECNQSGEVILAARLSGPNILPANDEGIWFNSASGLHPLALEGLPAPGGQAGTIFTGGLDVAPLCISDGARIAFLAPTAGGATPGAAIFAGTAGAFAPVLRPGDALDTGGGSEIISAVSLTGGARGSGLSGKHLVMRADLAGDRSAIVLVQDVLDLDGDDVADFLEIAFGTDPNDASDGQIGLPTMVSSGAVPAFEFRRQSGASGIDYLVEESSDLVHWSPSDAVLQLAPDQSGMPAGFERLRATSPGSPSRFFRLRVTRS